MPGRFCIVHKIVQGSMHSAILQSYRLLLMEQKMAYIESITIKSDSGNNLRNRKKLQTSYRKISFQRSSYFLPGNQRGSPL